MHTAEDLVAALATEDHLHAHGLDLPAEQVHRRARADCRHVKRLQVVDDIRDRIEALLHGERVLVVDGSQVVRRFARR